jgi:hypothetical protein
MVACCSQKKALEEARALVAQRALAEQEKEVEKSIESYNVRHLSCPLSLVFIVAYHFGTLTILSILQKKFRSKSLLEEHLERKSKNTKRAKHKSKEKKHKKEKKHHKDKKRERNGTFSY